MLFQQLRHALSGRSLWDSRMVISTLVEVLNVLARGDVKTEIIKELERQAAALDRLQEAPGVDHELLRSVLNNLNELQEALVTLEGQLGNEIRQVELLKSIIQRSSIAGGTCDFDLPGFHCWLEQPADVRLRDLNQWTGTLDPVRLSVGLILKLVRESAEFTPEIATGGSFQKTLDTGVAYQLIRVSLPKELPYFAEISGGKHRFSVRFMEPSTDDRPKQTSKDVAFQLSCCAL
jgi:cell division protein ZapD